MATDKRCRETSDSSEFLSRYNDFVRTSPQGILYSQSWWLDAVAPDRYEILTVEREGDIRAAWPLVWADGRTRNRVTMPPLTQKLGVLFGPPVGKYAERLSREHRLVEDLLDNLPAGVCVNQHFHESFTDWLPFHWHGFHQTTRYTYVLEDLTNLEQIWAGMRNTVRTEVRKARKANVQVRETDDLEYFYQVVTRTFNRQARPMPHSLDLVRRIDDACVCNAGRKILVGEGPDGQAHACVYLAYDERCATVIMSGGDERVRASGAGALLHWELIEFASTVTKRFDFEGSMIRPIEFFYRGFGPRQVPYFRIWGRKPPESDSGIGRFVRRARRKLARIVAPYGDVRP